jgi:hypothetical protein
MTARTVVLGRLEEIVPWSTPSIRTRAVYCPSANSTCTSTRYQRPYSTTKSVASVSLRNRSHWRRPLMPLTKRSKFSIRRAFWMVRRSTLSPGARLSTRTHTFAVAWVRPCGTTSGFQRAYAGAAEPATSRPPLPFRAAAGVTVAPTLVEIPARVPASPSKPTAGTSAIAGDATLIPAARATAPTARRSLTAGP